jgi:hypothetical protein
MNSHRFVWLTIVCVSAAFLVLPLIGSTALANAPIDPGFDLLSTPPFPLNLGMATVMMTGDPIGPGNTDTIVQRLTPGPPPGSSGTIPIELVALSLSSMHPVVLDLGMGAQPYDLHVGLLPGTPSPGTMIVNHGPGGGTFDSNMIVNSLLTFTPTGGGPAVQMPRTDPLSSQNSPWSHMRPPHYPENSTYPSGGMYPGVIPGTAIPVGIDHTGPHPHTDPSTPEPGSALLLLIGAMGIGVIRRAQR